jgi:hypothetical protein
MMTNLLLRPPYRDLTVATPSASGHPLGAIAFYDLGVSADAVRYAARAHVDHPWCAPCLRLEAGSERRAIEFVHRTGALPGLLVGSSFGGLPSPDELIAAMAHRPAPTIDAMIDYVVRRLGCRPLYDVLASALVDDSDQKPGLTPRTVRRRLTSLGQYRPWEWKRLATLALLVERADLPVELLADRAGTEPRTLRMWVRHLLGTSLAAFRSRIGWEWVVEAGLRQSRPSLETVAPARPSGIRRAVLREPSLARCGGS